MIERQVVPKSEAPSEPEGEPRSQSSPEPRPELLIEALPAPSSTSSRWRRRLFGAPRDLADPKLLHRASLVAFLAWVGLGADGLSSSAYGPEEAFKALGAHPELALPLFAMMVGTIALISLAYSNLIERFPGGGGGYLVASQLLSPRTGVVSGSALLVDYVLTITISIASACDQLFSFLPAAWLPYKLAAAFVGIGLLLVLNLRGVRESVLALAPVFLLFLVTHALLFVCLFAGRAGEIPGVLSTSSSNLGQASAEVGLGALLLVLLRAYSLGGGTYTGIEAVSNGVGSLREPRVRTGRRTMALMAISLAATAGGLLLGYLLTGIRSVEGRTMNALLLSDVFGGWTLAGLPAGAALVIASLVAEAALLFVAAQAGFLDGPRVLANMALDSWLPRRFSQLSDRLVAQNGVLLMGVAALGALAYTRGAVGELVVMYAINVFLTFSLSTLGMARLAWRERAEGNGWRRRFALHGSTFAVCATILAVTVFEKLTEGGWVTLAITALVVALCFGVRRHYEAARRQLASLDALLVGLPSAPASIGRDPKPIDRRAPTAVLCVESFSGFGLHQLLTIHRSFPRYFQNVVFVSAAVVDSGAFKGEAQIEELKRRAEVDLERYVAWARSHGFAAEWRLALGTEAVTTVEQLCAELTRDFPGAIVFLGKLVFREERWYHRLLHNETAFAIQRRLQFRGIPTAMLAVRDLPA